MLLWNGSCIVHETFSERKIAALLVEHPEAKLIAHPECEAAILEHAVFIGSTSALLSYVEKNSDREFIVATESGILHQMEKRCPDKVFIPAPPVANCACNECPYMKLNTLEKLYLCMKNGAPEIVMEESLRGRAERAINRMMEMS
jgi:quinolinate synthase